LVIELLQTIFAQALQEIFGLAGGALFLFSWMLQAWESRRVGHSIVSLRFFILRAVGCALLVIESVRSESLSLFIISAGTLVLNAYNIRFFMQSDAKLPSSESQ